jgi:hypothetical protein
MPGLILVINLLLISVSALHHHRLDSTYMLLGICISTYPSNGSVMSAVRLLQESTALLTDE